jgi:hypothetical protein
LSCERGAWHWDCVHGYFLPLPLHFGIAESPIIY